MGNSAVARVLPLETEKLALETNATRTGLDSQTMGAAAEKKRAAPVPSESISDYSCTNSAVQLAEFCFYGNHICSLPRRPVETRSNTTRNELEIFPLLALLTMGRRERSFPEPNEISVCK